MIEYSIPSLSLNFTYNLPKRPWCSSCSFFLFSVPYTSSCPPNLLYLSFRQEDYSIIALIKALFALLPVSSSISRWLISFNQTEMHQEIYPYYLLFITISFILIQIPGSFSQEDERLRKCSEPFFCGNIDINYPLWGGSRPEYCGHPSFEINCKSNIPSITIGSTPYKVIAINNPARILTLVRDDLLSNICLDNPENATVDFKIFSYRSTDQNITLYYGCNLLSTEVTIGTVFANGTTVTTFGTPGTVGTVVANGTAVPTGGTVVANGTTVPTVPGVPNVPNVFSCSSDTFGIYTMNDVSFNFSTVRCQNEIIARVNQTNAMALASSTASKEALQTAISGGFSVNWTASIAAPCQQCDRSGGRCGSKPDSADFVCHCATGTHPTDCNDGQLQAGETGKRFRISKKLAIVGSVGIAGMVLISVSLIYCLRSRWPCHEPLISWMIESEDHKVEEFMRTFGSLAPKIYKYSDLKKITNSFSHKIGQGGFGQVYKGKLHDGRVVAVKVLIETNGDGEEYVNEVASISRTSHVNIVGLLGFCYQRNKRALIYEYVSNGSLDKFLNNGPSGTTCPLGWTALYRISIGIARGLEYLHQGCNTRIVHFDIKPHNILLDQDFCPKISDFGLSRLCERKESILSMLGARGTAGYIAPEVFSRAFGHVSHKSDVYSYGMLVLEMVGVRNNVEVRQTSEVYFPDWIYEHLQLGKDLTLQGIMNDEDEEIARKMILVGLWCIQTKPSDRPAIGRAVEMLEGSLHSLQVPSKPVLFSPPKSVLESFTSTSTTT